MANFYTFNYYVIYYKLIRILFKMIIRKFKPTDADHIKQLFLETISAITTNDYTPEQIAVWKSAENRDWTEWISRIADSICYVVDDNNLIIAFANMSLEGHLEHLYTHKDFQRKGAASLLLRQLED